MEKIILFGIRYLFLVVAAWVIYILREIEISIDNSMRLPRWLPLQLLVVRDFNRSVAGTNLPSHLYILLGTCRTGIGEERPTQVSQPQCQRTPPPRPVLQ